MVGTTIGPSSEKPGTKSGRVGPGGFVGADGAGSSDRALVEDPDEKPPEPFLPEPSAAGIFRAVHEAERSAEGTSTGNYDVHGGEIFYTDDHAARDVEHAGGAGSRIGGGYLPDRPAILGQTARGVAVGSSANFAL